MFGMNRTTISILSVSLLLLSLLGPWFTLTYTSYYDYHEDFEKDGQQMTNQVKAKDAYHLDKMITSSKAEAGSKSLLGIDADEESQSATYTFYEYSLENSSGTTSPIFGFMHSLYKIFLLILVIRIGLVFGESVLDIDRTLLFTSATMFLIMLFFLFGFRNSYVSTFDQTIMENDAPGEPDINMTFIAGFGNTSQPNYGLDYNEITETYRYEKFTITAPGAEWLDSGDYFIFTSGKNIKTYYVWFDKNGDGETDKPTDSELTVRTEVRVNISALADNSSAEQLAAEIYDSLESVPSIGNGVNGFTLTLTGAEIDVNARRYGETDNPQNVNADNLYLSVTEDGGIDQTTNSVYSALETKVRWYPSWGFALFFLSAVFDLVYRDKE